MPSTHIVSVASNKDVYHVTKNGLECRAHILQHRDNEVYVHYLDKDKRLDEWVPKENCRKVTPMMPTEDDTTDVDIDVDIEGGGSGAGDVVSGTGSRRRRHGRPLGNRSLNSRSLREPSSALSRTASARTRRGSMLAKETVEGGAGSPEIVMTEEDYDIQHHKQITAQRNFDKVHFGEWQVKTWYFSPYPLTDAEEELPVPSTSSASHQPKIPGVQKTTSRSHGRTSDLLAGGLGRAYAGPEKAMLWVCQQCFKYMADGASYDLHVKHCKVNSPPGRIVYQKGAHAIWEVDGAQNKLYCQNLSLFGKLFIDVKTLFFDCDNFLFYILTDADDSQHDHIIGFFSKEKMSYDDYNLACIMTLPPYQRKGYGTLMIEFSYELSRRAGKVGTPERPLSDLGLRSYLAYWVGTIIRFFRRVLSVMPTDAPKITTINNFPDLLRSPSADSDEGWSGVNGISSNGSTMTMKRKKKTKGWAGEVVGPHADPENWLVPLDEPMFTSERIFETELDENGAAVTNVVVRCTLGDLARATHLRPEDAAFALNECGLLAQRSGGVDENGTVLITRSLVEKIAIERKVKQPCMLPAYVKLPPLCPSGLEG